jgi:hypothetical protein
MWVGVHADIERIAHQEKGRQVAQGISGSSQAAADADRKFRLAVAARAEGHQVGEVVG